MDPSTNQEELPSENVPQASQDGSQTAAEYISSQLQLEADAREVLPYQFDTCTYALGPLRQSIFSCLTCNPPPSNPSDPYTPAGVCYACSISCHGDHELVELFTRRNFVCDCGTTRLPPSSSCSLRLNEETGTKGGVHSEEPSATNHYNHNFRNRFCGCGELYDPHTEEGTMYQCYGLGNVEDGGCGEDWWHPECLLGLKRDWYKDQLKQASSDTTGQNPGQEHPDPPGFPKEDQFEHMICYKCVGAFPWIKQYAGTPGFLSAVPFAPDKGDTLEEATSADPKTAEEATTETSKKRKADDMVNEDGEQSTDLMSSAKRSKSEESGSVKEKDETPPQQADSAPLHTKLPTAPTGAVSLFLEEDFRDHLCRCPTCFPRLAPHAHLLEEEMIYEPPMSSVGSGANGDGEGHDGSASVGSKSLLDRGEAALSNMDRVKAIEGVMVYNHLRDKVKDFLKPFAESGQAVGAEDVKKYFEKLRGDEEAIRLAQMRSGAGASTDDGGDGEPDHRREQGGY